MNFFRPSIQSKVRYGYLLFLGLILIVSALNYIHLIRLDRKISVGFIVSELFDTTLEMRRYEKNFFHYGDRLAYDEAIRYTLQARKLISTNQESIRKLAIETDVHILGENIAGYQKLMQEYAAAAAVKDLSKDALESSIREKGKAITTAAESISLAERTYIRDLISSSKKLLFGSIIGIVVAVWLIGRYLSRMVVRPLKELESGMDRIADGKFDACDMLTSNLSDREIVSLGNACGRMIREIESRQMEALAQSEKLASLGTMVSGVAHQLNNPLSNIYSSCQILQEEIEDRDVDYKKVLLHQIGSEVERARTLVRSLLEFSRKKDSGRKKVKLGSLVDETLRLLKGELPARVEIASNVPEAIWVYADEHWLQQAILNIVKNAIDAIPDEGSVTICAREIPRAAAVELLIQDTGTGIEPEYLEKIFDLFFTTKADGKGSGLGLFVAKAIIEEHGGVIDMDSAEGEGTTFSIRLPLEEVNSA